MENNHMDFSATFLSVITHAIEAGQMAEIIRLPAGSSTPKRPKHLRRRVKASGSLSYEKNLIYHSSGVSINAIASWVGIVAVRMQEREHRFRLLAVDRFGRRAVYAVPMSKIDKTWTLPDIELSDGELWLLRFIADELRDETSEREFWIEIRHPAREVIETRHAQWNVPLDEPAFLTLLQTRQWLLPVVSAALDAQLRSFKLFCKVPIGIYNFITNGPDPQADMAFTLALRAMTFTNAGQYVSAAPPVIQVKEKSDCQLWRGCVERVVLIRTATGSLLEPIFKEIDKRERLRTCDGQLPPPLPTVPIIRCKAVLGRPFAVDVELPKGERPLTDAEQDLLRAAVARALTPKTARTVYDRWRVQMSAPTAYRLDTFRCWNETLAEVFLQATLERDDCAAEINELLQNTAAAQQAAEQKREQMIRRAIELICQPERYKEGIIERPQSKAEASARLDENSDAVAFRFSPSKGEDKGRSFLAFTRPSLARLLLRVSCGEELLDAVIDRAQADAKREIRLGSDTGKFVTFMIEK